MRKTKFRWVAGLLFFTVMGGLGYLGWVKILKPTPLGLESLDALEAKTILERMYLLEEKITCEPGVSVDVLAEVMTDSSDYRPTAFEQEKIRLVYGPSALEKAGFLTAKKAYYASRDLPSPIAPVNEAGPTLIPTARPIYMCNSDPESRIASLIHFVSAAQARDGRILLTYDFTSGKYEATLRLFNGEWKITSLKLIQWYGNG